MSKKWYLVVVLYSVFGWTQNWERSLSKENWKVQKFSDAQNVTFENGSKAVIFNTLTAIPFREVQEQKFKLKTLRGKSGVEWLTDLPNASAKVMLKTENNSKKDFFSELMVYL